MTEEFWEHAAQRDPLWASLPDPAKRGRRWDLAAFFETGRREISLLLYRLRRLDRQPRTARAMDFGCGVGRLTQALAANFTTVIGVDASPTMIELARQLNRAPGARYVLNQSPALEQFPSGSLDFIYSDIVLQHLEPAAAERYVEEFLRLLAPGGIAVFQLPSHKRTAAEWPPQPTRMPADAYRAQLDVVDGLFVSLTPAERATLAIDVHNTSPWPWEQGVTGTIRLGNHWRGPDGTMLIQDDGRAVMPAVVAAGATVRLALGIQAPPDPGPFVCEIDLVHEGITWFGDAGSTTIRVPVAVISTAIAGAPEAALPVVARARADAHEYPDIYAALASDGDDTISEFPMHGIPLEHMLDLIERHGAEAFFVEDDERGGPEWVGYRYFVEKLAPE